MNLQTADDQSLAKYLADYQRITLKDACGYSIHSGDNDIGIWVRVRGKWQHATEAERKIKWIEYQKGKSACESIIRELFGLERAEYERIRGSFERPGWQSWAGIYQAKGKRTPRFVIVLELPDKGAMSSGVAGGIGGAAGLALGVLGTVGTHMMLNKKSSVELHASEPFAIDDASVLGPNVDESVEDLAQKDKRLNELKSETEKLAAHIQKLQADKNNADFSNDAIAKQRDEYDGRLKIVEPGFDLLMKNIRTQLDKKFESEKQRYSREWDSMCQLFQWNMEQADKFQNFSQLNSRFDPHLLINHFQSEHDQEDWLSGTIQGSYFYKELITWWLNEYLFQILRAKKPQLDEVSREDARKRVQSVIGPLSSDNYEQAKVVNQKLENFYQQLTFEYYAEILKNGQFRI